MGPPNIKMFENKISIDFWRFGLKLVLIDDFYRIK